MRLGFQDIGPHIKNMEPFTGAETLILSGNYISELTPGCLQLNVNLQFLSLSKNKLTEIKNLNHLVNLEFLDLSDNLIEAVNDISQIPQNILSLKLIGNPIEQRALESKQLSAYRKPFVLGLADLTDMDKVEVIAAERMSYQGILPRSINLDKMLFDKIKNDAVRMQGFKLQQELKVEIKREQGKTNTEIVNESLDEFAKMDEMEGWLDNLSEMMVR